MQVTAADTYLATPASAKEANEVLEVGEHACPIFTAVMTMHSRCHSKRHVADSLSALLLSRRCGSRWAHADWDAPRCAATASALTTKSPLHGGSKAIIAAAAAVSIL